jgi:Golgi nucleoside diphosphatase
LYPPPIQQNADENFDNRRRKKKNRPKNNNLQQGTRLHVYEWDKRFLLDEEDLVEQSKGKLLSYPTSNNRWTDKYTPGLDEFAKLEDQPDRLLEEIGNYLGALLDFARDVLRDKKDEWHTYPIYLKATGGLRTLPQPQRIVLINTVRKLFHNKTFCPFSFEDERARVISGEEEAIYGWVGVNFGALHLVGSIHLWFCFSACLFASQ